jgi:flagellar motility protein MotE (MotC chaperone)
MNATITWDLQTETIQTILTHLDAKTRAYVLAEMSEQDPEQGKLAQAIADSDHEQAGW